MAFTPVSGLVGRVSEAGTVIGFLKSWKMTKTTAPIKVYTFENTFDSDLNIWPTVLRGLSEAKVSCEGVFDASNPADYSAGFGLSNGLFVTCSFILVRLTPYGFSQVSNHDRTGGIRHKRQQPSCDLYRERNCQRLTR